MLSKRNLKNYSGRIVKINFKDDAGYIVGLLTYQHGDDRDFNRQYYYITFFKWEIEIPFNAIKDFMVIDFDAMEKSQKLLQKANGRKLNGNGKIKRVLHNTSKYTR